MMVPTECCSTRPGPCMSDRPLGGNPDMFSIPAAGLAKTLIGVTISLHAAPAHHVPGHYTVRPGDTLSDIARQEYGSRADWPALWWTNRHNISNPDAIVVGQKLRLSTWHPHKAWLQRAGAAAAGP